MILKKALILPVFSSLLFISTSCNHSQKKSVHREETKEVNSGDYMSFSLSNTLYLLAPEFNSTDCQSFGECDCCASNYVFLDNENFICVNYCLEVDAYYGGKYKIDKESVELKYNSTVVKKEYNWESETDTTNTQPEYFYKIEKCKPFQSTWKKFNCKEKICFKTTEKETNYASVDKTKTSEDFLGELKKEGILQRLNIK